MKNFLLFIVLFFSTVALNAGTIEKTYYFENVKIQQSGEYHLISFENTFLTGKTGEPTLPYNAIKLILPPGEIAKTIEFIGEEEIQIPGYFKIYPSQASRPLSDNGPANFIIKEEVYNKNAAYPSSSTGELLTEYMNGYAIGLSSFTPLKYNPSTGTISYYKKVKIKITTAPDPISTKALQNISPWNYTNENRPTAISGSRSSSPGSPHELSPSSFQLPSNAE